VLFSIGQRFLFLSKIFRCCAEAAERFALCPFGAPAGGTRQRRFDGTSLSPETCLKTRRLGEGAFECDRRPPRRIGAGVLCRGSGGRVREWRLGIMSLVSIPCHIEPDMRFSLTRSGALRQPSSWSIQDIQCRDFE
jgi:hypothetical protein